MKTVNRIAQFGIRDLVRSRWLIGYAAFFAIATGLLLRFSDTEQKALLSLVNVVLFVVPLASIVFGSMYLYGAREFVELMLAQPVPRRQLFAGLFLGLTVPLAGAVVTGIGTALVVSGVSRPTIRLAAVLVTLAVALSVIFTGIAAAITYRIEDRVRGLATALGVWLMLALVYDALTLMIATQFADYPIERSMLFAMIANPIDLARLLLLFQFDVAALLGYTGAVFQRFFEGAMGLAVAISAIALWTVAPAFTGARLFHRKDF